MAHLLTLLLVGWLGIQADVYVCPMHPEIQSPKPGTCLRCGMALLRGSSDPAAAEFLMGVEPAWASSGQSALLRLTFRTPAGRPAGNFQTVHEKELHLFVVGRDLQHFAHVHPTRERAGTYTIRVAFPRLGEYMLLADFVPEGASPQMLQRLLVTPGFQGRMPPTFEKLDDTDQIVDGLRFSLRTEEFRAGTPALLTFSVTDAASGQLVKDLEPYLGAVGHLFFADGDFADASHSHPLESGSGPSIRFLTRFNGQGPHRFWLQVQHRGRVVTATWTLDVPKARD